MRQRLVLGVCLVVIGSMLGAAPVLAHDDPNDPTHRDGPATTAARTSGSDDDIIVEVGDNFFKPKRLRVRVGDTVTWEWAGSAPHNVVVTKGPRKFESDIQTEGTYERTIRRRGRYQIVCTLHPGMTMRLIARKARPASTTTTSTRPS